MVKYLVKHLDLEKAVDYLIDKTPEGAPFRDGADLCRLSERQRLDDRVNRRAFAVPSIIRLCKDGAWKATGKKPGSADREHIPGLAFIDSKINWHTGNLMSTRSGRMVAIWTELKFSVPGGANEGEAADTKGGHVGRRPASQSQAEKIWEAFDERQNALTFNRGELADIAGEIGEATGYKQNTVEKIIRPKYRDLEPKKKQNPT